MKIPGIFITATDTGVGKTYFAAAMIRSLRDRGVRVGAYKPAASGGVQDESGQMIWEDVEALSAALGGGFERRRICPQKFRAPLAPPFAARSEGNSIDAELLRSGAAWWQREVDVLIVEGAGGLLSPLSEADTNADLARDLGLPLLIVARLGLGTINHSLLTVEAAVARGLQVAGIVLTEASPCPDDASKDSNAAELAARCSAPILGVFPYEPHTDLWRLPAFLEIDWLKVVGAGETT